MAPYKVREGLEVEFDFSKISVSEWRSLGKRDQTDEDEFLGVAKLIGLSPETIGKLNPIEYERLCRAMLAEYKARLTDPS
jgi:hypothetical protein